MADGLSVAAGVTVIAIRRIVAQNAPTKLTGAASGWFAPASLNAGFRYSLNPAYTLRYPSFPLLLYILKSLGIVARDFCKKRRQREAKTNIF